jgi:energy-coupling factor transporter transmembrane protein EcfT
MAGRIKSWPWKLIVLALSVLLVFTPLPKYPELLSAYREPEFILTFWATMTALLISVLLTFFGARLPDRVEAILWIVIGISAAVFAPWMFGRAMPDIDRLYHYAIGWGIIAEVIGGVLMALIGGVMLFKRNRVSTV